MAHKGRSLLLLAFGILLVGCRPQPSAPPTNAAIAASIATGNQIITAIESYRSETGQFPDLLDSLVPDYLNQIPAPQVGATWRYYREGDDHFVLEFGAGTPGMAGPCYFASRVGEWGSVG